VVRIRFWYRPDVFVSDFKTEETIVLDPPGQPELTTHHMALPRILQRLEKLGYRVSNDGHLRLVIGD
jgi:hypothetical protein